MSNSNVEQPNMHDLARMHQSWLFKLAIVGYTVNHLIPALRAIGFKFKEQNDFFDGYICEYTRTAEGGVLYFHGYRHPQTKKVRAACYFNWEAAQESYFGSSILHEDLVHYYVSYGGLIERGIQETLHTLGASQEDFEDHVNNEKWVISSLLKPDGYVDGFKGVIDCFAYLFGLKSAARYHS